MRLVIPGRLEPKGSWKDYNGDTEIIMSNSNLTFPRQFTSSWISWLLIALALILLSLGLAWVSTGFLAIQGWVSFVGVGLLGAGLLTGGVWLLRSEAVPGWVVGALLAAVLLRLAAGVLWMVILPTGGYNSQVEQGGYVMADAYERDQTAWELARSDKPLDAAFQGSYRKADQYGGLLFLSALIYRYLGGAVHQPLLMVVLTAFFSALAVLFTWAFARRAWGDGAAKLAAWGLALYPEAVLLGSSQMREAFTITLVMGAFYGLVRYWQDRKWAGLTWVLGALLLALPFSPPNAALLLGMLILMGLILEGNSLLRNLLRGRRIGVLLGGLALALVVILGLWLVLSRLAPAKISDPVSLVLWWARKSADYQMHLSKSASGWIQKYFRATPDWVHGPLLLVYGVLQPLLPAALSDITSTAAWRGIAIWRSLGWTLLLPFLVYAPLRAWGKKGSAFSKGLCLVVWLGILAASFRGGGDLWDNPRYRVMFAGLQVALAAWVWAEQRRSADIWLRRILIGLGLVLVWFMPWYLRRYIHLPWPVVDLFKTLGLGVASAVIYWIWDWARSFQRTNVKG
jgi:hypothetical protein